MLSAEHYALENELVRSVLEIKQKEIQWLKLNQIKNFNLRTLYYITISDLIALTQGETKSVSKVVIL